MLPVSLNDEEPTSITVRLVQPCVEQRLKWKREHFYDIVSTYIDLSFTQKEGFKPKIIIWPEAALPLFLNENPEFIHLLSGLLPDDTYLITGSLRRDAQNDIFNSLYILKGQHGIVSFYDKAHLVPFGEYLPFRSYLPSFIQKITPGAKDYSCGDGPKTLSLDTLTTFSPLICYESIFSNVRSPERPDFLLTITNDGWFGSSFGPVQHLHQAKARAIEEGLPLIRVGNNGISAVIDASGAILSSLALNEKGVLDAFIPKPHKKTLYATFGDNFFFLALGLFFAIALVRIKYKSKDNA